MHALAAAIHGHILAGIDQIGGDTVVTFKLGTVGIENQPIITRVWNRNSQIGVGLRGVEVENEDQRAAAKTQLAGVRTSARGAIGYLPQVREPSPPRQKIHACAALPPLLHAMDTFRGEKINPPAY